MGSLAWIAVVLLIAVVVWLDYCIRVARKHPWDGWRWFFNDEG